MVRLRCSSLLSGATLQLLSCFVRMALIRIKPRVMVRPRCSWLLRRVTLQLLSCCVRMGLVRTKPIKGDDATPPCMAPQEGHLAVAQLLCENCADQNQAAYRGATFYSLFLRSVILQLLSCFVRM